MQLNSKTLSLAPSVNLLPGLKPPHKTLLFHQICVLVITFLAYASFHASRKPPSIVKSVLGPTIPSNLQLQVDFGWPPFNGTEGTHRLGELDLAFLTSYPIGMYLAGHVGDRIDLRLFLVFGMMGSGFFTILFGLGYWLDVHVLGFYVGVQIVCGVFQSIGWHCVVVVVGNWLGESKRGLIMGIWNSHTSVGNIIGSVVASGVLDFGWGWSFVVPRILIILVGILVFLFFIANPEDMGFVHTGIEIEIGGVLGGITAGFISDMIEARANQCCSCFINSSSSFVSCFWEHLYVNQHHSDVSFWIFSKWSILSNRGVHYKPHHTILYHFKIWFWFTCLSIPVIFL